ncbi:methionyl-tRNA synthetase [Chloroherpeton thalassium ATCC 35110]|uniref:Methionine--tRNA ligase n=1 Tax=Chloroherpeton thalassium (strain ATCC 35110 / GB-78) TaxID=517418 RepID=SYM_CHLT3|nr:methionine--tRNA ligase [Chloroherpeton thalassium]B3QT85.1 RecName: Full=Methionine--tRNA ligase; AltName: Full=Methionyl-tRNA synthetase; Short=MetRS [Chloroherpeton thalassium ATCC 35110]ACF14184.1 methionyl-tRNA synthetase [Chloroherpeton thalassium ATCC 35110]
MSQYKRTLVTTALPYANGPVHLGHLAGVYLPADIYVRFKRLKGEDVIHIGGSDEHGVPITLTADKEGVSPQVVVDRYHNRNSEAFAKCGISFDHYGRTSSPVHHETAQEFFLDIEKKGIFTKKVEKQFYDEESRHFLSDRYVTGTCPVCGNPDANGDQCEKCGTYLSANELINPKSKLTGKTPILKETLHWYFPLGRFQKKLEDFIEGHAKTWRQNVINYSRTWLRQGLGDRAITRDLPWGVKVPLEGEEAKDKVLYVWFDAVLGYISSTKEWAAKQGQPDLWKTYWQSPETRLIHFIGKDNVVFHALMFPAILMAKNENADAQYVLVDNVPASEFMNFEGKKFSKSRNYAVYLHEFLEKFPADTLRYSLAINYPESRDTDFSWKDFQNRTNGELADTLGNFVKRAVDFTNSKFQGEVPAECTIEDWNALGEGWHGGFKKYEEALENFHIREACFTAMDFARFANRYLTESEPWKVIKTEPEKAAKIMAMALNLCETLATVFAPILPETSAKIFDMLGVSEAAQAKVGENLFEKVKAPQLAKGHKLSGKSEILFRKIEDADIQPELDKIAAMLAALEQKEAEKATENFEPIKPTITFDEFEKIDLRVAKVLECERVPKTDKLLRLKVQLGTETRQVLAGLAKYYTPEALLGKNVVMVANLAPRKMRGMESQGMVLAVEDAAGCLQALSPEGDSIVGKPVK